MKHFTKVFFRGLLTLLPISLSLYLLYVFFTWVDQLASHLLSYVYQGNDFPGLGILVGLILIYLLGLLMSSSLMQKLYEALEAPIKNIPFLKSVYSAIRDLTSFFNPDSKKNMGKVVVVNFPHSEMELVGFLTRDELSGLPQGLNKPERVSVYLPMSYQIGGYTVFVPKEWVREIDLSVESAMKSTLTAWMPSQ